MPSQKKRIRKAVFPVAGLGTRFLPATKAVPKEMLTVVDRPVIQHVVDEAKAAGIEHFIFVTGRNKGAIEDHFDSQYELERTLAERGKTSRARPAHGRAAAGRARPASRASRAPLGLGHAVWCAREIVGNEPFALLLPDMLHHAAKPCLADMIEAYEAHGGNHIAVSPVPDDQTHLYGIVGVEDRTAKVSRITGMIEKPPPRHGALQSAHHRALYPAAGDIRHPRARRARRRRRDPDHRCHDQACRKPAVLRRALRRHDLRLRRARSAS